MEHIDVPRDGNCLLHCLALEYLRSSAVEDLEFRANKIFGHVEPNIFEYIKTNLSSLQDVCSLVFSKQWCTLVQKFREQLTEYMCRQKIFFVDSNFHPDVYLARNNAFLNTGSFEDYIKEIKKPGTWLGSLEIRAACYFLERPVIVKEENRIIAQFDSTLHHGDNAICLVRTENGTHYKLEMNTENLRFNKRKLSDDVFSQSSLVFDSYMESKKMKLCDSEEMEIDVEINETPTQKYKASGLKRSLHGVIFQIQLLMLHAQRGKDFFDFILATEMDKAEKFDDVVFRYKKHENSKWQCSALQAKHKQDTDKNKITVKELTTWKDDEFSLQKYFVSFCKIKNQRLFDDDVEDFIICTNTDFNLELTKPDTGKRLEDKQLWRGLFEQPIHLNDDDILYFDGENSKQVQFKNDDSTKNTLSSILKSVLQTKIQEAQNEAGKLTKRIDESDIIPDDVKLYLKRMLKQEFLISSGTFFSTFLDVESLLCKLEKKDNVIKKDMVLICEKTRKINKLPELESEINNFLSKSSNKNEKTALLKTIRSSLKKIAQTILQSDWIEVNEDNASSEAKIDDLVMALKLVDTHIKEFVEKLRFVVNFPDADALNSLISEEIGSEFALLNPNLITNSFEKVMTNWLKEKFGRYITKINCDFFFTEFRNMINGIVTSGLGKVYPEKLYSLNIKFRNTLPSLEQFIWNAEGKQILHIETDNTELSAIKVLESMKILGLFDKEERSIFMSLEALVLPNIRQISLESFSNQKCFHIFVIKCFPHSEYSQDVGAIYRKISSVLQRNKNKKLILIALKEDLFARKFKSVEKVVDKTLFEQLDLATQQTMRESLINFQGKYLSLDEILDVDVAQEVLTEDVLMGLAKGSCVSIGDDKYHSSFDFVEEFYITRKIQTKIVESRIFCSDLIIFVTDASAIRLRLLGAHDDDICILHDGCELNDKRIIISELRNNDTENRRLFKKICTQTDKNVHWVKYDSDVLYWMESKKYCPSLNKFISLETILEPRYFFSERDMLQSYTRQKVVIIADSPGTGKSTFLSKISAKMKEYNPDRWILRINLIDCDKLDSITFRDYEIQKAIEYFISIAVSNKTEPFSANLLRFALDPQKEDARLKVFIFFDGYDEITPYYKEKVAELISALKHSDVAQIWVTTRIHVMNYLENKLEQLSYKLNLWNDSDQMDFLSKFWRYSLMQDMISLNNCLQEFVNVIQTIHIPDNVKYSLESLRDHMREILQQGDCSKIHSLDFSGFAALLLTKWKNSVPSSGQSLTNIPLNLRMLAEITFKKVNILERELNLLTLYSDFFEIKLDIFYKQKRVIEDSAGGREEMQSSSLNLKKIYQGLAAKLFFPEVDELPGLERLQDEVDQFKSYFNYRVTRVGLLEFNSKQELTFVHRSFGEYCLHQWVTDNLKHQLVQKLLLKVILCRPYYGLTCDFFELYIGLNLNSPQLSLVEFSDDLLQEIVKCNSIFLHTATLRNHVNIINYLIERFKRNNTYLLKILSITNGREQTAIFVAILNCQIPTLTVLLNHMDLRTMWHFLIPAFKYGTIYNSERDSMECLRFILRFVKSRNSSVLKRLLSKSVDRQGGNILHRVVLLKHHDSLKMILCELADYPDVLKSVLLATNEAGETAFTVALINNDSESVQELIDYAFELEYTLKEMIKHKDNDGNILHVAVERNALKSITVLISCLKSRFCTQEFESFFADVILSPNIFGTIFYHVGCEGLRGLECCNVLLEILQHDLEFYTDFALVTVFYPAKFTTDLEWLATNRCRAMEQIQTYFQHCLKLGADIITELDHIKQNMKSILENANVFLQAVESQNFELMHSIVENCQNNFCLKTLLVASSRGNKTILYRLLGNYNESCSGYILEKVKLFPRLFKLFLLNLNYSSETLIHGIAKKGNEHFLMLLLNDVSSDILRELLLVRNIDGESCLHVAARLGHFSFVELLINKSRDHDLVSELLLMTDKESITPLEISIMHQREQIFSYLLRTMTEWIPLNDMINLVTAQTKSSENILFIGLQMGTFTIVEDLITWMYEKLDTQSLRLLLTTTNTYPSLLHAAKQLKDVRLIPFIMKTAYDILQADVDNLKTFVMATDSKGQSFLHIVCSDLSEKPLEIFLTELLKYFDKKTIYEYLQVGHSPLHTAICSDNCEAVKIILQFVEENLECNYPHCSENLISAVHPDGNNALLAALINNSIDSFEVLIDFVIEILEKRNSGVIMTLLTIVNSKGFNVLHFALEDDELFDILAKRLDQYHHVFRALIQIEDNNFRNILFPVFYDEFITVNVKKLLSYATDETILKQVLYKEDKYGLMPLQYAYWLSEYNNKYNVYFQFLVDVMEGANLNPYPTISKLREDCDTKDVATDGRLCRRKDYLQTLDKYDPFFSIVVIESKSLKITKSVLSNIIDDNSVKKSFFASLYYPIHQCSYDVLNMLIKFANSVITEHEFFKEYFLSEQIFDFISLQGQPEYSESIALVKSNLYDLVMSLVLHGDGNVQKFSKKHLELLRSYFKSEQTIGGNRRNDILRIIDWELTRNGVCADLDLIDL